METISLAIILAVFCGGLFAGSFINCLVYRLYVKENFVTGRSYCPKCRHNLAWYDLIPILSFLFLRGDCRYCQKKISWQYPLVELASGILAVVCAWVFAPDFIITGSAALPDLLRMAYYWILISVLMVIFITDLLWYIIPDEALVFGTGLVLLAHIFSILLPQNFTVFQGHALYNVIFSALGAMVFFLAITVISSGKWMGLGDVKYAFLMGLILGFPEIIYALFASFFSGAVVGAGLIAAGKKKMSSQIPFGPFLVFGTVVAILFTLPMDFYLNYIFAY